MLNLSKSKLNTYTFSVVLPNGTIDADAKITVRGNDHPVMKAAVRKAFLEQEQQRAQKARKGKTDTDAMTEVELDALMERILAQAANRVEKIVGIEIDGKEIGTDVSLIAQALDENSWLKVQVEENAQDAVNFFVK